MLKTKRHYLSTPTTWLASTKTVNSTLLNNTAGC